VKSASYEAAHYAAVFPLRSEYSRQHPILKKPSIHFRPLVFGVIIYWDISHLIFHDLFSVKFVPSVVCCYHYLEGNIWLFCFSCFRYLYGLITITTSSTNFRKENFPNYSSIFFNALWK